MARLNPQPASSDAESEQGSSPPQRRRRPSSETTPESDRSSDKENDQRARKPHGKRKSSGMAPESQKRRRTTGDTSQTPSSQRYFDPHQDPEERRNLRKGLRSLLSRVQDQKSELVQANSNGLIDTFREADKLYKNVKQTSEATIDSRLLVEAADLSYKKINNLTLGDGSTGMDVDDFVTKVIFFMKQGNEAGRSGRDEPPRTQTQTRRRNQDDEDDDAGDTMNWEYLGNNACFLYNKRPCLTGFLLGPLSVQKKVRQQTQRRAREARADTQAVRPIQLGEEELNKQESASLTELCTEIFRILDTKMTQAQDAAQEEVNAMETEPTDEESSEILRRHGIADDGNLPLFNFCINPKSFGQSVENFFYVSFLIKEGKVGLDFESHGLPTLGKVGEMTMEERQEAQRNQAVFTLDFDIWEDIIKSFNIEKSIIPHRIEEKYDDGTVEFARNGPERVDRSEDREDSDGYS